MLTRLQNPMSLAQSTAAGLGILVLGAFYCFAYTWLQGDFESPFVGAAWAAANLLPWLAAFEYAKRARLPGDPRRTFWRLAMILSTAALASLLLEAVMGLAETGAAPDLAFQVVRRVPGALLVLTAFLVLPLHRTRSRGVSVRSANDLEPELPLLPKQIEWIKAAGNYLEFHSGAGMVMRRLTMAQAQAQLAPHGFVRIHRSTLVNGTRIARIRRGKLFDEVELLDGRVLKVGTAFRASLTDLERRLAA